MKTNPIALALSALSIYAFHDALIKYLGQYYSVIQIVFFAALFTFPLFSIWLLGVNKLTTLKPTHPWALCFRSLAMVTNILTAFYAFQVLPLAQAYALLFTAPLIVTALSGPFLKEKVDVVSWAAVCFGFVGVLVVLQPSVQPFELGHFAALTAALVSALNSVMVRKIGASERSIVLMFYPMMATLLVMSFLIPFVYQPMPIAHMGIAAAIAAMSLGAGILTIYSYRRGKAIVIAPMQYSQILWGALFGFVFFNEAPSLTTLVGATIIILSGLVIIKREKRQSIIQTKMVNHSQELAQMQPVLEQSSDISIDIKSNKLRFKDN